MAYGRCYCFNARTMPSELPIGPASSPKGGMRARGPLRVIVIDDLPDTVMMLLTLLRGEGYQVQGFGSGVAALKHFEAFDPDVVICDIAMPSVNGWELAREVRRVMGDMRPMLIAISGQYTQDADKISAETAGYNYYLTKPYDPRVLMELLSFAARGL